MDMEKLASGLERMNEDDLLHVVQLVHDNKSEDTYTKNDVESEFRLLLFWSCFGQTFGELTLSQMESSMSISTRCLISWSRCSGTLSAQRST